MPRAFGFDGDSAMYESLERKVLADEAARKKSLAETSADPSTITTSSHNSNDKRRLSNPFSAKSRSKDSKATSTTTVLTETSNATAPELLTSPTRRAANDNEAGLSSANSKKSVGEKVANFLFNGGRRSRQQQWGEQRVGMSDGHVEGHVVRESAS
ncbi:uncharacterized protein AB675_10036 [Cyphellophora attinorum]|uniref:Uncharacterized protein n=1 Tax=Cyphellophora attinorum TaxID=1664694 RepID=A0A0N1NWJ9_9EURO|nr:uncharacterized protein AB675_10036 [Phialophora attinorum]KPI36657.1 hypothetical protein AB675_10036 [Phialophora attinorum]